MKRQISIFTVFLIASILSFSGCMEINNNNDNNTDEIEIINHYVVTEAYSYNTNWTTFGDGFNPKDLPIIVHNDAGIYLADEFTKARYRINGTVKNIADHVLNSIIINLNFYDGNNTFLTSEQLSNFSKLQVGSTWNFEYEYDYYDDYFENVDNLEITTGPPTKEFNIPGE